MFKESQMYNDSNVNKAIDEINEMDADLGGTEIAKPLTLIEKIMAKTEYNPNIFVITDGQVNDTEAILEIIARIRREKNGRVHMVGIGNGISVDMIKRGAQFGGGFHLFIMN
jgi:uncharacterized protein with von Willebrand factor type A (vWA) domain